MNSQKNLVFKYCLSGTYLQEPFKEPNQGKLLPFRAESECAMFLVFLNVHPKSSIQHQEKCRAGTEGQYAEVLLRSCDADQAWSAIGQPNKPRVL
jgi:hypothetical protein